MKKCFWIKSDFKRKSHDGHSKIQERSIRRKQQQQGMNCCLNEILNLKFLCHLSLYVIYAWIDLFIAKNNPNPDILKTTILIRFSKWYKNRNNRSSIVIILTHNSHIKWQKKYKTTCFMIHIFKTSSIQTSYQHTQWLKCITWHSKAPAVMN